MDPDWIDVFPIEHGDIPASYVSLPEGTYNVKDDCLTKIPVGHGRHGNIEFRVYVLNKALGSTSIWDEFGWFMYS